MIKFLDLYRLNKKYESEFNSKFRGDILVRIKLAIPKNLNEEQISFLDKYKNIFTPAPMQRENPIKGIMYFFLGIIILINKHRFNK